MWPWTARLISQLFKFRLHFIDQRFLVLVQPNCLVSSQKNPLIVEEDLCKKTRSLEKPSTFGFLRVAPVENDSAGVTGLDEPDKGVWISAEVANIDNFHRHIIFIKFLAKSLDFVNTVMKCPPSLPIS